MNSENPPDQAETLRELVGHRARFDAITDAARKRWGFPDHIPNPTVVEWDKMIKAALDRMCERIEQKAIKEGMIKKLDK